MKLPLQTLPMSPTLPGFGHIIVVPPGIIPDYVFDLAKLNIDWSPSFSIRNLETIECDDMPEIELELLTDLIGATPSTTLTFKTRNIDKIPIGSSFIVQSETFGLLLLSAQHPHMEVKISSSKPNGDPVTYSVTATFLSPPIQLR